MLQWEPERADKTLELAQYFRDSVADFANTGTSTTQIVPVIMGSDANALAGSRACAKAGFDIRAIRPPTVPKGTSRLRIAFNANLDRSDVDRLVHCLRTHITGASS